MAWKNAETRVCCRHVLRDWGKEAASVRAEWFDWLGLSAPIVLARQLEEEYRERFAAPGAKGEDAFFATMMGAGLAKVDWMQVAVRALGPAPLAAPDAPRHPVSYQPAN